VHAADIDDPAPTIPSHMGRNVLDAAQSTENLHVQLAIEGRHLDVWQLEGNQTANRRRAVDQDVYGAKLRDRPFNHGFHRLVTTRIRADRDDPHMSFGRKFASGGVVRFLSARDNGYRDALTRKLACDRFADATASAGDDGGLASQLQMHRLSRFALRGGRARGL